MFSDSSKRQGNIKNKQFKEIWNNKSQEFRQQDYKYCKYHHYTNL